MSDIKERNPGGIIEKFAIRMNVSTDDIKQNIDIARQSYDEITGILSRPFIKEETENKIDIQQDNIFKLTQEIKSDMKHIKA